MTEIRETSTIPALAQTVAATLIGLVALPLLLGVQQLGGRIEHLIWLACGVLIGIWLLVIAPSVARGLAMLLSRLGPSGGATNRRTASAEAGISGVAQWLVALGYVLLVQSILRRPLVLTLSVTFDSVSVEAIFAATVLVLLIVVLLRLHWAARPLVEMATWSMLDALIATSGSEPSSAAATTIAGPTVATSRASTVAATRPAVRASETSAATLPAPGGEVTLAAPRSDTGQATVLDDRSGSTGDRTALARTSDDAATVVEPSRSLTQRTPDATILADAGQRAPGATTTTSSTEAQRSDDQTHVVEPADATVIEPQNASATGHRGSGDGSSAPTPNDRTVITSADETMVGDSDPARHE